MILELELIGDDTRGRLRGMVNFLDRLNPGWGAEFIGKAPVYVWVAEITGLCGKFGFERKFLRYKKDYSRANSIGSRGVYAVYILDNAKVYEVLSRPTWGRSDRYFARVDGGKLRRLTKEEVEACFSKSAA